MYGFLLFFIAVSICAALKEQGVLASFAGVMPVYSHTSL
jgi:hypothetical protein